jgi:hypothetical protein
MTIQDEVSAIAAVALAAAAAAGWLAWWRLWRDYRRDIRTLLRLYIHHAMPEDWGRPVLHAIDGGKPPGE